MNEKQFYRLELDDMATPSFTSFGKFYYGTMEQLSIFMKALEEADHLGDHFKDLTQAFHSYEAGKTDVQHSVAYRDVPLLVPVRVLHEETHQIADHSWEHRNIWGYPPEFAVPRALKASTCGSRTGTTSVECSLHASLTLSMKESPESGEGWGKFSGATPKCWTISLHTFKTGLLRWRWPTRR